MASFIKKCELCGESHNYTSGHFTRHLLEKHDMTLKDYVIKFEYNGVPLKCSCGYCNEEPLFARGKFIKWVGEHKTYKWRNEQYIKKYGPPKCRGCGKEIGFKRDIPKQYCSFKCLPNNWNQEKIKKTVNQKYGVVNVANLQEIKDKISNTNKNKSLQEKEQILKKTKETNLRLYGDEIPQRSDIIKEKSKQTFIKNFGVDNYTKTKEFKKLVSERMIKDNPMKKVEVVNKMSNTYTNNLKNGKYDFYKTKKYKNTNLTYQSSYEKEFLELCESNNILNKIQNGNIYKLSDGVHRTLTDFSFGDYEIEIKSSWIMKKQGGINRVMEKKNAIEKSGKRYIFILDKDYTEFLDLL